MSLSLSRRAGGAPPRRPRTTGSPPLNTAPIVYVDATVSNGLIPDESQAGIAHGPQTLESCENVLIWTQIDEPTGRSRQLHDEEYEPDMEVDNYSQSDT
jgi:hypothetical protein